MWEGYIVTLNILQMLFFSHHIPLRVNMEFPLHIITAHVSEDCFGAKVGSPTIQKGLKQYVYLSACLRSFPEFLYERIRC